MEYPSSQMIEISQNETSTPSISVSCQPPSSAPLAHWDAGRRSLSLSGLASACLRRRNRLLKIKRVSLGKGGIGGAMSKKNITGIKLTTTHIVIIATNSSIILLLPLTSAGRTSIGNRLASVLRPAELLLSLASAAGALVDARATALGHAQEFADLEEVGLDGVDETLGLPVLAGSANADAAVFDDVSNTETFA